MQSTYYSPSNWQMSLGKSKENYKKVEEEKNNLEQKICQDKRELAEITHRLQSEFAQRENELIRGKEGLSEEAKHLHQELEAKQVELERSRRELSETISRLKTELEQIQDKEKRTSKDTLDNILPTWPAIFQRICDTFDLYANTSSGDAKISQCVESIIKEISIDGEKIAQLEIETDQYNNHVYSAFQSDLPGLKDIDYKIFLFNVLGFSTPIIALLTRQPPQIYTGRDI